MNNFSDIQKLLKIDIKATDKELSNRLKSNVALVDTISSYIISAGGKRLRPLLLLLCAKATGYNGNKHYLVAIIIELIHTATLLHDDVVDESSIRRGKHTVNNVWGNASSVLVGDFLYSRAFEIMVEVGSMQIMQILSKITNNIAEGELLQLLSCKNANLSAAEYFNIIECKTACLFQAAAQIGAILSNADIKQELALKDYGMYMGNVFQIMDDILDYESSSKIIGKKIGDDLAEGKNTLPMIYALENTTGREHKILKDAIENADNSNIEQINSIFKSTKAFIYARQKAQKLANLACESLDVLGESTYKKALILLCDLLLKRKS